MAITINPRRIKGKWTLGYALDIHALSSTYLGINEYGHDVFETKRSELGELLLQLKYRSNAAAADGIIEAATAFLQHSKQV